MAGNREVVRRIAADLEKIWGEMAVFMIKKRLRDVGATPDTITDEQLLKMITLLERKTLASTLGVQEAHRMSERYRRWVRPVDVDRDLAQGKSPTYA